MRRFRRTWGRDRDTPISLSLARARAHARYLYICADGRRIIFLNDLSAVFSYLAGFDS